MMKKVKHLVFLLTISIISITHLFGISITNTPLENPFPSEENLNSFNKINSNDMNELYDINDLNNIEISLITITPGEPVYSWFGHSAIMINQNDKNSIIYDYGIFSFNSENFYENFLLGKMYYLVVPSNTEQRLALPIKENRNITKVVLNISNEAKINIINFLNYNVQRDNNTYLYDFYIDNCATRIRDIFNWITDDDFKQWAQNEYTPFTYRILSTEQLDRSIFINWILNSFLGKSCDVPTSTWENMFSPEYLEMGVIEYEKFNVDKLDIYKSETASTFQHESKISHHLLIYSLFGLILGFISLNIKKFKQDNKTRFFGIFNSIIILFLFLVSLGITFLMFFSHIQPAWNNENILFLNPLIYFILLLASLRTISKRKGSTRKLVIYERLCNIYSVYLIVLIVLKTVMVEALPQQNYIIIIPILLFFFIQSFIYGSRM